MRVVHLHGHLGELYGSEVQLNVPNVASAVRACCYLFPGFKRKIAEGHYHIVRGSELLGPSNLSDAMHLNMGSIQDIHIIPVPVGAGGDGFGKIIIGTLILATAFIAAPIGATAAGALGPTTLGVGSALGSSAFLGVSFGQIAALGGLIALSGVSQLISPTPKVRDYTQREKADQRGSFLINSRVNTIEEGLSIPLIYGRTRTGSSVISAGIAAEAGLTNDQIIVSEGWVTNIKLYRWKSVGIPLGATSAYSVKFTNTIGDSSLPDLFEDVTFYGYHQRWKPVRSDGFSGVKPAVYLQAASLAPAHFAMPGVSVPIATQLQNLGFPYEDQQKRPRFTSGITTWEQNLPVVDSNYPGLRVKSHASPWVYDAMWTPAGGSLLADGRPVQSALEYEDGDSNVWFQLVIGKDAATNGAIQVGTSPTEDYFDIVTIQADDADRTTLYELNRSDATTSLLYNDSRVWRWSIDIAEIAAISAPASPSSDKFFWIRLERYPNVKVTQTLTAGRYRQTKWTYASIPATTITADSFGVISAIGDQTIETTGPLYNTSAPPLGYFTEWNASGALPLRESDYVVFFGGPSNNWAVIINTPGRPQDWFDSFEVRSFTDNSLIIRLETADATQFKDDFALKDGTTGTMWTWEGVSGQPVNQVGSALAAGSGPRKVIFSYVDRNAQVN